jgi:hypothetical protein
LCPLADSSHVMILLGKMSKSCKNWHIHHQSARL